VLQAALLLDGGLRRSRALHQVLVVAPARKIAR